MSLSSKNLHPEFEIHEPCEQQILFVIERLDHDMKWRPVESSQFRSNGRYILYDPAFKLYFERKATLGPFLEYENEQIAKFLIKKLIRLSERPLRIQRVQTVRIHRTVGKILVPTGGI